MESAVFHRSLRQSPQDVVSAKGHYLQLAGGRKILDATGGAAVACLGHGETRVRDAIVDQMSKVSYCASTFYGTKAAEDLGQLLVDSTNGEMARAFFINSGSEAMEAALKLARQYHCERDGTSCTRVHFIARKQSYHGTTLGALDAGGHTARRSIYEPILSLNTSHVSPCYAYRSDRALEHDHHEGRIYVQRLEDELEAQFQKVGPSKVAAFIAEPIVGAALGCVPPVQDYFRAMRRVCDRHGALLILDEVMCGAGRVGPEPTARYPNPLHAWQDPLVGVVPDIMTMGKGLGGGYIPFAAMLASKKVVDRIQQGSGSFLHGQTYQAHPLACRAALEVQRIIQERGLVANAREKGYLLGQVLERRIGGHPSVGDIRGKGLFWGIEFVKNKTTREPFKSEVGVANGIHELGMQEPHNISLYPGTGAVDGALGDHVLVAPAYNVTAEDIRMIVDKVAAVVEQYFHAERSRLWPAVDELLAEPRASL